jgi:hypothetical protein
MDMEERTMPDPARKNPPLPPLILRMVWEDWLLLLPRVTVSTDRANSNVTVLTVVKIT